MGGENLLEKAEEQERLLEESAKELEERKTKAEALHKALEEKEVSSCLKYVSNLVICCLNPPGKQVFKCEYYETLDFKTKNLTTDDVY